MTANQWAVWIVAIAAGAAVGSFLNVVIYRLPRGMSIRRPRSHCPSCGARLRATDLIPVLSWLFLLGRCRYCGHRISARYPLVELITALLAGAALYFHPGPTAVLVFAICAALVVAFFVDLDHMIIPDEVHWVIASAGVVLDLRWMFLRGVAGMVHFTERVGSDTLTMALPRSLVGAAVGGASFLAIGYLAQLVFRRPALGMGDVKLAAALGTVLGPGYYFVSFFLLATVLGGLVGLVTMALGRARKDRYIPFGPMLAVAGIVMTLAPEQASSIVLSRFLM